MAKDLIERIEQLEAGFQMTQYQLQAQQHVLAWLLSRTPQVEVQGFLEQWMQECAGSEVLEHDAVLISALREDLQQLREECASSQAR